MSLFQRGKNMSDIAGITIGPIVETISNASSPAALWFASYFYSDISKRICQRIYHEDSLKNTIIYVPEYDDGDTENDGVGKYNDRIIFRADKISQQGLSNLINDVKRDSAKSFKDSTSSDVAAYLEKYLQISFVILPYEKDQTVGTVFSYLDTLELMRTVPEDDRYSPFSLIFKGEENSKNIRVKKSGLFKKIDGDENQLINYDADDKHIWRIEEIAAQKGRLLDYSDGRTENFKAVNGKKWPHYYVIVNADGDHLGNTIKKASFENNSQGSSRVTMFSKACKEHAKKAAKAIREYGGITIYAGGDDLLFLAPIIGLDGNSIFSLCYTINNGFGQIMKDKGFENVDGTLMSLSFGVSIHYYKFPLYEALEKSRDLLFQSKKYSRNAMAISLSKHSGQSIGFLFQNNYNAAIQSIIDLGHDNGRDSDKEVMIITSISKTLLNYSTLEQILFNHALDSNMSEQSFIKMWLNSFDNPNQKVEIDTSFDIETGCYESETKDSLNNFYTETGKLFYEHFIKTPVRMSVFADENSTTKLTEDSITCFISLLEFRKFMCEKEGER